MRNYTKIFQMLMLVFFNCWFNTFIRNLQIMNIGLSWYILAKLYRLLKGGDKRSVERKPIKQYLVSQPQSYYPIAPRYTSLIPNQYQAESESYFFQPKNLDHQFNSLAANPPQNYEFTNHFNQTPNFHLPHPLPYPPTSPYPSIPYKPPATSVSSLPSNPSKSWKPSPSKPPVQSINTITEEQESSISQPNSLASLWFTLYEILNRHKIIVKPLSNSPSEDLVIKLFENICHDLRLK